MNRWVRRVAAAAVGIVASAGVGCSSVGETFGLSSPQHKLLPEAQAFRQTEPPPGYPRELTKALHPAHVVEPGDVLLVQPSDLDAPVRIVADQPVLADGTIDLGKYGRPVVAGKTVPVIEAEIQQAVKAQEKEPVGVNVRIINRQSKVFYVLGEVNAPGAFPLTGRESVLDAIVAAGGLTRRASERNVILSRPTLPDGCRVVMPVCYPQIVQLGDTTTNYQVMNGDRIFVPSKGSLEDLFPNHQKKKNPCPPCDKLQVPCVGGACPPGCDVPAAPAAGPVLPPAALPAVLPTAVR